MSEKKQMKMYIAVSQPILDLRIRAMRQQLDMDAELFKLESAIWRKIHAALKLPGAH